MKIPSNIGKLNYYKQNQFQSKKSLPVSTPLKEEVSASFSYRDYNISFGERLNRTPEEFYSQPFNQKNMPITVKKYLHEDFEERQHMPPAQLQREAFQYLKIADNVDEVLSMYPDETLFADLRPFSQTNAKRGTLFLLRWDALTSQTPIFKDKNEKDLTVYFLKKVYLDGKTHDEINKDFDKDATDEIKRELGVKDGNYFSYADFRSLGIKYPNISYYNSFLATRKDKEYIPSIRKIEKTNDSLSEQAGIVESTKTNVSNEILNSTTATKEVSEETREKISEAKKRWWANLSDEDRTLQIKKMMEGKELSNSVFAKYQGPIMTIAAAKIGFSERLISIIAEKYADSDFLWENETYSQKQREIMFDFWNKDSSFRDTYAKALNQVIAEFEEANVQNEGSADKLESLLNQAFELKKDIVEKAHLRKLAKQEELKKMTPQLPKSQIQTPTSEKSNNKVPVIPQKNELDLNSASEKEIIKLFRQIECEALQIYPEQFRDIMLRYIMKNTNADEKRTFVILNAKNAKEILNVDDQKFQFLCSIAREKVETLNKNFNMEYPILANTNDFILNRFLYGLTGDPMAFKFERGDFYQCMKEGNFDSIVKGAKKSFEKDLKRLAVPMTDRDAVEFWNEKFKPYLEKISKEGLSAYKNYNLDFNNLDYVIKAANAMYVYDENFRKATIAFIRNHNAVIRFINGKDNGFKTQTNKNVSLNMYRAKDTALQKMIVDYLSNVSTVLYKYISQTKSKSVTQQQIELENFQKLDELAKNFSYEEAVNSFKYYADNQMSIFSEEFKNVLIDYIVKHPTIKKSDLVGFVLIESGIAQNENLKGLQDIQEALAKSLGDKINEVNKEFDKEHTLMTKSNEFAVNLALYKIKQDIDVFKNTRANTAIDFVMGEYTEEQLVAIKKEVDENYKKYSSGLTIEEAKTYYQTEFLKSVEYAAKYGFEYHDDISKDSVHRLANYVKTMDPNSMINYITAFKGAVDTINDPKTPEDLKNLLREHILYDFMCEVVPENVQTL